MAGWSCDQHRALRLSGTRGVHLMEYNSLQHPCTNERRPKFVVSFWNFSDIVHEPRSPCGGATFIPSVFIPQHHPKTPAAQISEETGRLVQPTNVVSLSGGRGTISHSECLFEVYCGALLESAGRMSLARTPGPSSPSRSRRSPARDPPHAAELVE